ncbi:MAG: Abi family protein [Bacilli bacterium]|nr:Abi family protein [Bacilli bacterium]
MQVLTTNKLIKNIEKKGISIDSKDKKKFKRYSYYQVVNAYKNIFVEKVENIDDIKNNILQGIDMDRYQESFNLPSDISPDEAFLRICKYICKKYDRQPESDNVESYIKEINEMEYYHHIYSNRVRYSDFIRIYKFEHELRTIMLRYVLIIEESLKNIFVSYLNNSRASDNFLMDISNYISDSKKINESIDSIKLVLEKQKNKYSKPITRKKSQRINIPYWIIINELTLKETLKILNNLSENHYNNIYLSCLTQFTRVACNSLTDEEKRLYIDKIRSILELIANFRNLLAHNQPLYLFNVKDVKTDNIININYDYPRVRDQNTMNSDTMSIFANFFGSDRYNSRTQNVTIDLSWIIYTIYKIISTLDSNSTIYDEIVNVYRKYSIVNIEEKKSINDYVSLEKLLETLDDFLEYNYNSEEIINKIESTSKFKQCIKHQGLLIENYKRNLRKYRKKISIVTSKPKYNIFQFLNRYTEYTGIDKNYFDKLK